MRRRRVSHLVRPLVDKDDKPKTAKRAYDLFYQEIKDKVNNDLEKEWKKKYKSAPYTKNPTE